QILYKFLPNRPQARFCSPACQDAAQRWRRWRAAQCYRATTQGKQRRSDQARRYRRRRQQRTTGPEPPPPSPPVEPEPPPMTDPPTTLPPAGEGQRPDRIPEQSSGRPCDRPGCYDLFLPTPRSPLQHFCSCSCRRALRRVRQREARHRQRRRRGGRPLRRCHRGPPTMPPFMSSHIENPTLRGLSFVCPQRPRRERVGRVLRSPVSSLGKGRIL